MTPESELFAAKTSQHLRLIAEANQHFNLTRIVSEEEAAIKHVLDSVMPWRLFEGAKRVLDAGTGAGFPGIPLALVLPDTQFTLSESIGKKARFVASAIEELAVPNATLAHQRAEELLRTHKFDIVTARAVAPLTRALDLFHGTRMLLYKGPDAEQEIAEAAPQLRRYRLKASIAMRYDLPQQMGTRTIVLVE